MASSRWFQLDQAAVMQLTHLTSTPGQIVRLPLSAAPVQLPGASAYYASSYIVASTLPSMTIGGELVEIRSHGETQKGYRWLFASSSDGNVYGRGPFKNFDAHHSRCPRPRPSR